MRDFLKAATLPREFVDRFLDPKAPNWAVFDPELGYTLQDCIMQDGLDNAFTIGQYAQTGERLMINYADRPCRINAYGDSFTQCHQVSDGETWEEYLAAHLGEPIRNFGVGGYGVYQAYRRMLRTETTARGTPYVILNIYGSDDHHRSLDAWRYPRFFDWFRRSGHENMFHANPWVHVRFDEQTGKLLECENPLPTPRSLYQLCDEEFVYRRFKDDIILQMHAAERYGVEVDSGRMERLAHALGLRLDFRSPPGRLRSIHALYQHCAMQASIEIVKKALGFAAAHHKKLMILLSYGSGHVVEACQGKPRADQSFVDFLLANKIRFADSLARHVQDYQNFRISPEEYVKRYYIGHYNPVGNHFFAFAIKNEMVDWLDPKPVAYAAKGQAMDFKGYLNKP